MKPISLAVLAAVAACGQSADASERFYGKKSFTIVYEQSGMETGEITEHVRDFGRNRVEITKTVTTVIGIRTEKDQRVIHEGAQVTTVDNQTGSVTTMTNPLYEQVVSAMNGRSGSEFGKEMMRSMGGRATSGTGQFAGQSCSYWEVPSIQARLCVTDFGATLHLASTLAGLSLERKAISVRMGDGGPDSAFAYDASSVQQTPNLDSILQQMRGGQ